MVRVTLSLLAFCLAAPGWAAKVISVTPENDQNALVKFAHYGQVYYHWIINDLVCLSRSKKYPIVCGRVAQYDKANTVVRLAKVNAQFMSGEEVRILYTKTKREVATTSTAIGRTARSSALAAFGFGAGLSYLLFHGQFSFALARKITMGITVPFAKSNGELSNVSAIGALLTANYYVFDRFSGYNLEAGVGPYFLSREVIDPPANSTSTPIALYSTFGWKGRINRGLFSLGVAGGFQFVGDNSDLPDFKGIMPLFAFSFGVNF